MILETDTPFQALWLQGSQPWPKYHRVVPGFLSSSLLHLSVLFLLARFPVARLLAKPEVAEEHHTEHLVYISLLRPSRTASLI